MVEVVEVETTRVASRRDTRWFLLAVVLGAALSYGFLVSGAGAAHADQGSVTVSGLDDTVQDTAGKVVDVADTTGGAASAARAAEQDTKPEPEPQPAPERALEPRVSAEVAKVEAQPAQEPQVSTKAAPQPAPEPAPEPQVSTGSEKTDREPTAPASVDRDPADSVLRQPKREVASTASGLASATRDVVPDVEDQVDATVSHVDHRVNPTVSGVGDDVDATVSDIADLAVSTVSDFEDGVGGIDVLPSVVPQQPLVEQHLETVTDSLDGRVADVIQIVDADGDLVGGTELEGEPGALLTPLAGDEDRTETSEAANADRSDTATRAGADQRGNGATGSAPDADRRFERSATTERSSASAPVVSPQPRAGAGDLPVAPEANGALPGTPAAGGGPRTIPGGSGGTSGNGGSVSAAFFHSVSGAGSNFLEGLARHASWALPASRTLLPGFAPD
jgi:hypothetical protein